LLLIGNENVEFSKLIEVVDSSVLVEVESIEDGLLFESMIEFVVVDDVVVVVVGIDAVFVVVVVVVVVIVVVVGGC
jgi:hypothetical protein